MKKRMVYLLLSSAAVSALSFASLRAHAVTEVARASAFRCALLESARYVTTDGINVVPSQGDPPPTMGIHSASIDTPRSKLACPVDNIASMATSITEVKAQIEDNSDDDSAWAITCVQFSNAVGGSCGAGKRNGNAGIVDETTITLTTNWPTEAAKGFPYLYVELPFGGPQSGFTGYVASKN